MVRKGAPDLDEVLLVQEPGQLDPRHAVERSVGVQDSPLRLPRLGGEVGHRILRTRGKGSASGRFVSAID